MGEWMAVAFPRLRVTVWKWIFCCRIFGLKRKSFGNSYKEKNVLDYEKGLVPRQPLSVSAVCRVCGVFVGHEARMPYRKGRRREAGDGERHLLLSLSSSCFTSSSSEQQSERGEREREQCIDSSEFSPRFPHKQHWMREHVNVNKIDRLTYPPCDRVRPPACCNSNFLPLLQSFLFFLFQLCFNGQPTEREEVHEETRRSR